MTKTDLPSTADFSAEGLTPTRPTELGDRVRALQLPPPASAPARTGGLVWIAVAALAVICGWLAVAAYFRSGPPAGDKDSAAAPADSASKPGASATDSAAPPPALPTGAARGDIVLESKGYVIAAHQILVSPKVNGMIVRLNAVEGRRLKQGDVIAELEKTEFEADRDRAQAALAGARAAQQGAQSRVDEANAGFRQQEREQAAAELAESQAQMTQLESEYNRNADLHSRGHMVSAQDLEVSQSKYLAMKHRVERLKNAKELIWIGEREERKAMARAELTQAEAQVRQAEADLVKAQWKLDNCTIRAPISGTVLKKNAEEGNIVNPIAFNGSFSICELADLADLEVELHVQERSINKVRVGQKCTVQAEAFPERNYSGVVSRLMPIADRAKAAVPVRVKLTVPAEEEGVYLKPEMGAVVWFHALPAKP